MTKWKLEIISTQFHLRIVSVSNLFGDKNTRHLDFFVTLKTRRFSLLWSAECRLLHDGCFPPIARRICDISTATFLYIEHQPHTAYCQMVNTIHTLPTRHIYFLWADTKIDLISRCVYGLSSDDLAAMTVTEPWMTRRSLPGGQPLKDHHCT